MLIEVSLEKIYNNGDVLDLEKIESIPGKNRSGVRESIGEIIRGDVRIQVALADIVLKNFENDIDCAVSFVLLKNEQESKLISQLQSIFESINILCCKGKTLAYEVCSPTEEAVCEFQEALVRDELSKWIHVFYSDINAGDCDKIGLYKYCGKVSNTENISRMNGDAFFSYHLRRTRNPLLQPGFYVSQYRMDEIEKIPYIDELFTVVENLYVIVSRVDDSNGEIHYEKFLTWDALK